MNAERLLAHYEQIAEAPDAIARLRRFVLDLAVRGKLVPQDATDEPASELLKRIAKEKARLGIKNQYVPLQPGETPFDLPIGWSWSRIGQICSKTGSGSTPRGGKEVYKQSGVPFLRSQNIYDDGLRLNDVAYIAPATHERMNGTRVSPGDLLLNITGGSMGRCCLIPNDFDEANISQHVAIIRVALKGVESFLHRLVLSPYFQAFVFNEQTGAGRGGLPKNRMDLIVVALPPLAEQHRIVAKVDELMGLCGQLEAARASREGVRDRLAAASLARLNAPDPETFRAAARFALDALPALTTRPDQIKQLRQAILNLAVRGKLVQQDSRDEPASELLKRIAKEKARPGKAGEVGRDVPPNEIQQNGLPLVLPDGWTLTRLATISRRIHYGYTASADAALREVRLLRITDIQKNAVAWETVPGCEINPQSVDQYRLEKGDILIARTGGTIGKTFLVGEVPVAAVFASYLIRVQGTSHVFDQFLKLFLETSLYWTQLYDGARGTGQPNVNGQTLGKLVLPLPPLAEQHRIVARVDALMALCDRLEANLTTTVATRRRLLDALLAEALVPAEDREMEAAE